MKYNNRKEVIAYKRGYRVTEYGQALNPKGEDIGHSGNYCWIKIRINGKSTHVSIHRLQAFQKYGYELFEEGIETRHLNGDGTDNSWDNIVIGTHSENMMDIPEQVRIKRAKYASSYLKKHNKEDIKKFHSISKSYQKTMEKFKITSKGTLHYILNS